MVSISYIDNVGLEDYWSYETLDLGRSGGAYINQYNGLLTYVHQDINLGGNITYLSAAHIYSNNHSTSAPYGYGFRLSANETITAISETADINEYGDTYTAYFTDADGTAHYFKKQTDTESYFEFDDNLILAKVSGGYELRFEDGSKKVFDSDGKLTKIIDRNGNTITQAYDTSGRVRKLTDAAGRSITFNYSGDFLASTTDHADRTTTYTYSGGYLMAITYPDGKSTVFSYSSNRLQNVKTADSENVSFSYTSSDRVSTVFVKGTDLSTLKSCNFEYTGTNTIITDSQGRRLTVGFDNMGRAVSFTDKEGNTSTTKYNTGGNVNNTVAAQSDSFSFSNNLIKNHSFENGYNDWIVYSSTGNDTYSLTNAYRYVGTQSLMLTRTGTGILLFHQDVYNVIAGKEYTFSAYVKTTDMDGGLAGLCIEAKNGNSTIDSIRSTVVNSETDGWSRIQTTLICPSGTTYMRPYIYLEGTSGTAYFDAIQFEEASSAGHYNLLENPGFDRYLSDSFESWSTAWSAYPVSNVLNSSQAAAIRGSINDDLRLSQYINIGTSANERTIIFGGTAKADCAASSNQNVDKARFCIVLELVSQLALVRSVVIDYDAFASSSVQMILGNADIDTSIDALRLHLLYDNNVNTAYFDDFFII